MIFIALSMFKWVLLFSLFFVAGTAFGQKLKGRVFESQTRIVLADILVENLTNKQSLLTDAKGRFSITAKVGDMIRFKSFAYEADTLVIINMREKEVFMEPKKNQLSQVNIKTTETSNFNTYYDPLYHGQTAVYHRDKRGYYDGGIILRFWYWKKDEHKKAKLNQKLKDFDTMDKIALIFTPKNLSKYIPLTGADMDNFIGLYTPGVKEYTRNNFELAAYLNDCYKKYQALPLDKRKPDSLEIN
ncbi:hypothetical protein [Mucilaginibacter sp.]|jgi:hypothetical protein|uniref:hypothetical protein n=1 Tax=Mucilaginibacter sp. TaxID=1882438 RepID=UPI003561A2BE